MIFFYVTIPFFNTKIEQQLGITATVENHFNPMVELFYDEIDEQNLSENEDLLNDDTKLVLNYRRDKIRSGIDPPREQETHS